MNYKLITVASCALILGIIFGKLLPDNKATQAPRVQDVDEIRLSGYKFINPLLECEYNKDGYIINGLDPLHDEVEHYLNEQKKQGNISEAAVYFRDLNNGPWFGINEHADFSPASLLKLPVMMAYLKMAEEDPLLLQKEIKFEGNPLILSQDFSKPTLIKGNTYTVQDLIEKMITFSDNDALVLLEHNIDNEQIDKVTKDLGVETANVNTPENYMSVKGYAGLFRILFNASYLSPKYSEIALTILSKTQFENGLVAGIPKGTAISHKYGERELPEGVQLHECGIIYYPSHPYLLCVMTRGSEYNKLAEVIKNVSRVTYNELEKQYGK